MRKTKTEKTQRNILDIRVWVDRKFVKQTRDLVRENIRVDVIASGKLRRYANLKWWYRWFSAYHIWHTHIPNFIDIFKIIAGCVQSFVKLILWRPDVIFCKGGFVCLPVGLAAHLLKIPLVIHDSDTVPGLTNRVLSRFASTIGTGTPIENYPNYPRKITKFVGIPIRPEIKKLNEKERNTTKKRLGFDPEKNLIFAFGGGGGATEINKIIAKIAPEIIAKNNAQIFLGAGKGKMDSIKIPQKIKKDFRIAEFITDDFADILSISDVIVARAGASSIAEFAAVSAATILVPSPYLAGDHQTKNAEVYEKAGATILLNQREIIAHPELLTNAIDEILQDENLRKKLSDNLSKFARPNALDEMTKMIISVAENRAHS